MSTPNPITASVGLPTPIPERPILQAIAYLHGNEWRLMPIRPGNSEVYHERRRRPGTVVVTIPGSTPPSHPSPESKPDQSGDTTQMVQPVEAGWRSRCKRVVCEDKWVCVDSPTGELYLSNPRLEWIPHDPNDTAKRKYGEWRADEVEAALSKAPQPPDIQPEPEIEVGDAADLAKAPIETIASAVEAVKSLKAKADPAPVVQPWPKDLNELVGKRITTRGKSDHHDRNCRGKVDTCEVECVDGEPDWLTVKGGTCGRCIRVGLRDLLSIEPAPQPTPSPAPEKRDEESNICLVEVLIMGAIIAHIAVEESEGWLVETLGVDRMTLRALRHDAQDAASAIMGTRLSLPDGPLPADSESVRKMMAEYSKWQSPLRTVATIAAQRLASKIAALKGQSLSSLGWNRGSGSTAPATKSSDSAEKTSESRTGEDIGEQVEGLRSMAASYNATSLCAQKFTRAADTIERLTRERDQWKASHDNQVELKRQLLDRPDLKDRAESIERLTRERDELKEAKMRAQQYVQGIHEEVEAEIINVLIECCGDKYGVGTISEMKGKHPIDQILRGVLHQLTRK